MNDPAASARSGDSDDTIKSGLTYSPGSVTEAYPDPAFARQLEEASRGLADWNAHRQQFPVRFTVSRDVEALPPSPPASKSDEEMTPSSRSGGSAGTSQRSPVTHEEQQSVDRGAALSALTKTPAITSGGRKRRPVEPKTAAARRHTVATVAVPQQYSAEEDKPVRSFEGSLEGLAPEKRERRMTAAAKFKSTAAAIKGGRLVLPAEEQGDGGAKSHGMARIPLLKDIPKARDGRRATVQVTTPRAGSSFSPKLSTGSKGKMSPVTAKKLGKKGSTTFQSSLSISPRDLSPPSARARRMSAPPPRRATHAKIAPTFPSRARNTVDRSSPPGASPAPFKANARRKTVKLIPAKGKSKASGEHKDEELHAPEAESTAPLDGKDERGEGSENGEAPPAVEPEKEPPYPYLTLKELPPLDEPIRPLSHLCALPLKCGPKTPPPAEDSVTFIHVLERSERLTQEARDEATQRALSHLCNDGPGTMLMVARWLDSAADAVESNSITSSEKFSWRDIVPPFFVGANKHRELLSSKMPRTQFSPKELQEFLEKEGFIETQGQKLQNLLQTKGLPTDASETAEGTPAPKPRTPLDDYLDYLLAVAVYSLRKRQRPVVIAKITQSTIGASDESGSSSSCWRPDVVTSYCEHMALKQRHMYASAKLNSSVEQKEAAHSPTPATNPEKQGGGLHSPPDSSGPQEGGSSHGGETAQNPVREGETAGEERTTTGGADCAESKKGASPSPGSPLTSPRPPSSANRSFPGSRLRGKNTNECAESPKAEPDGLLHVEGSHIHDKSKTSRTPSSPTSSHDPPPSPKTRTTLRHRAADSPSSKGNGGLVAGSPRAQHTSATHTSAAKAKAKKHAAAKTSVPRVASIAQKTGGGSKPLRPLGQTQWQAPSGPGELPSVRESQKEAKLLAAKQASPTAEEAECELPESVGTAGAVHSPREEESPAPAPMPEDLVKSPSQADAGKAVSAAQVRIGETSPKRPPEHPPKKQGTVQSKALASRSSSTKRFNSAKHTTRRPGAAPQPERTGPVRKAVRKSQSPTRARLTREAMDLLSEPQVLVEMAKLCTRLSDLVCCRQPPQPDSVHSGDDESSVT
ncbi:hypothetical protein, conserved [Eimeria brunetti]|uniref:Uncharacterized protein n=1 Tax=Eimeria brunetti TaxID=51314 RepID=U6M0A3_9EIME|nr:hypothetical protein, conserved [Eimeria brunetti]